MAPVDRDWLLVGTKRSVPLPVFRMDYDGFLKPHLAEILKWSATLEPMDIAERLLERDPSLRLNIDGETPRPPQALYGAIRRVLLQHGIDAAARTQQWLAARREHAWLLRAEGLKYREIASRFGVARGRSEQLVQEFSRRVNRALRHTRWRIIDGAAR